MSLRFGNFTDRLYGLIDGVVPSMRTCGLILASQTIIQDNTVNADEERRDYVSQS